MKQKFLVFSDLHISNKNSKFRKDAHGVSDLIRNQLSFVKQLVELTREEQIDTIVFLGDLTDYSTLDPISLKYTSEIVRELTKVDNSIILEGNHCISDSGNNFTVLSGLASLCEESNNRVEMVYQRKSFDVGQIIYHCFPYSSDYKQLEYDIKAENDKIKDDGNFHILLFHFPCLNAILDNGIDSMGGVSLTQDIVDNFHLVLGGDFHKRQKLKGTEHAYYVGAPFDLKFGEHDRRGALIVEIDDVDNTYTLKHVDNDFLIPIIDVEYEDIGSTNLKDKIVRIRNVPKDIKLENELCYSLSTEHIKEKRKDQALMPFIMDKSSDMRQTFLSIITDEDDLIRQKLLNYYDMLESKL